MSFNGGGCQLPRLVGLCGTKHPPKIPIALQVVQHRIQFRAFATNNNTDSKHHNGIIIPAPSWSIADLELTKKRPPLPPNELERLARLALIDIHSRTGEEKNALNQDLANMLYMVKQVTEFSDRVETPARDDNSNDLDGDDLTCGSRIYDLVRGVTEAPLRKSIETDPLQKRDAVQAQQVWESFLEPKTIRKGGGHQYFSIATADDDEELSSA